MLYEEWKTDFLEEMERDSWFTQRIFEILHSTDASYYLTFKQDIVDAIVDETTMRVSEKIVEDVIHQLTENSSHSVRGQVQEMAFQKLMAEKEYLLSNIVEDVASMLMTNEEKEKIKDRVETKMLEMRTFRSDLLDLEPEEDESSY